MNVDLALEPVVRALGETSDRVRFHEMISPIIADLCRDEGFIFDAIRRCLSNPAYLNLADSLALPVYDLGELVCTIHLFVPIRDGARNITQDNIHHHGWRLLSTGMLSGDGYDTIVFRRGSHEVRHDGGVRLEIDEVFHHTPGRIRFLGAHTAHVIFHPPRTCATLAIWSADRSMINQSFKRRLTRFPRLRKATVRAARRLHIDGVLGINTIRGNYFHPEGGRIVETRNYSKPHDGTRDEILNCVFYFLQQIGFDDFTFLKSILPDAPPEAADLAKMLILGKPISDIGVWGDSRRRFTKTQILQALDHSVPGEHNFREPPLSIGSELGVRQ